MKSKQYLNEIRKSEGLERAVIKDIVVKGRAVTFRLITDKTYSEGDVAYAKEVSQKFVPEGFTAEVTVMKSVPDRAAVKRAAMEFLNREYPAAAAFIAEGDIVCEAGVGGGRFVLYVGEGERARFENGEIVDALTRELALRFCGAWSGESLLREKAMPELTETEEEPEYEIADRYFPISNYRAIDGAKPQSAIYIADINSEAQGITVCGSVLFAEEKTGKNGKPYFSFTVSDGTGQLRTAYFPKKATIEKVRGITRGDFICLTGDNEIYNGGLSFSSRKVDFGTPPENFVPQPRPSLPVPARYKKVVPTPVADYEQGDMFGKVDLPPSLTERDFVVFDLETTGLNNAATGGNMDRIIEVGAVRIRGGRIAEKFSTFVACPVKVSVEITQLTGIDDSMLVGAPEVGEVMADFFKFCDGANLVAHNAQFDIKFVRHYAAIEGYRFEHKLYDTMIFAQQVLRGLSNYKLNTIADRFGFKFNHHRAYDDAFVTAKIFIELARINQGIPPA